MPAPTNNPALEALRTATAALHRAVETASALRLDTPNLTDYARHLSAFHAWLHGAPIAGHLEGLYALAATRLTAPPLLSWMEADLRDLARLGIAVPQPATPAAADSLASRADALGILYLLEGSRLGAHVILKAFAPCFPGFAFRFLRGDGVPHSERWKALCLALAEQLNEPAQIERACASSQRAFCQLLEHLKGLTHVVHAA